MKRWLTRGALAACLALTGCGSSPGRTADEHPSRVPTVSQDISEEDTVAEKAIEQYMNEFESGDPQRMKNARRFAHPGSGADVYLLHQAYLAEAELDAGAFDEPTKFARKGEGFESCGYLDTGDRICHVFDDFKTRDGKVSDFTVNRRRVSEWLVVGDGKAIRDGGAKVEFLTGYLSGYRSSLWVTLKVTAVSGDTELYLNSSTYRSPSGKQRTASSYVSPLSIADDSHAIVAVTFLGADLGGRLTVDVCVDSCELSTPITINVG